MIAWPFSIAGVWATQNWSWHTLTDNLQASHDKISSKQSPVMKIEKLWLGASGTDQVFYCAQNSNQFDFYTPLPPNTLSPHPNPFPQHLQWWKWSLHWHKKNVKCQTETRSTTNPIQCNKTTCFLHCAIWEWRQQNNSHYYLHSTPPPPPPKKKLTSAVVHPLYTICSCGSEHVGREQGYSTTVKINNISNIQKSK